MRYYIANHNCIPLKEQPERGYTLLQVIARVRREVEWDKCLLGLESNEAKKGYTILDNNFHECKDLYSLI